MSLIFWVVQIAKTLLRQSKAERFTESAVGIILQNNLIFVSHNEVFNNPSAEVVFVNTGNIHYPLTSIFKWTKDISSQHLAQLVIFVDYQLHI